MPLEIETTKKFVPWKGWEVLLFFFVWFMMVWFMMQIVCAIAGGVVGYIATSSQPQAPSAAMEQTHHGHPIAQLIEQSKNSPAALLVVFLTGVVVAPLIEEFLFRLLLQGWLEAKLLRYRVPFASGIAIITVSFFFALIHAGNSTAMDGQMLLGMFTAINIGSLAFFTLGILYLIGIRDVQITRYFFGTERRLRPQFFVNAGYCILALLVIVSISAGLDTLYPHSNMDPIPIFFFSVLLGIIYSRTQNLSYCILFHACLNGISLVLTWLTV